MKKYINPIPDGGAPLKNNRLIAEINGEPWDVMQGIVGSEVDSLTYGAIISGCVVSGGGPYNISAGIVYLDGEFRRVPAQAGVTFPRYIYAGADVTTTKLFADGGTKNLLVEKVATSSGVAPGGGQYIPCIDSETMDYYRYRKIGAWTTLPLSNGWVGYNDSPIDPLPQYRIRYWEGMVEFRGTAEASGSSSSVIASGAANTLPKIDYDGGKTFVTMRKDGADLATLSVSDSGTGVQVSILVADYNVTDDYRLDSLRYYIRKKYAYP